MARWLLDCEPLCGHPWRLGIATDAREVDAALRLRYGVFIREEGYGQPNAAERDHDALDDWCDHLILWDDAAKDVIGTYRAIAGAEAIRRDGFHAGFEFDYRGLEPIAAKILQGGRTCVATHCRQGPAFQYLSYGMELLRREHRCDYFLGIESFRADRDELARIAAYLEQFGRDDRWHAPPQPGCTVDDLPSVPVTREDERTLPGVIRLDLRMGFHAISTVAIDRDFGCYDVAMLGERAKLTKVYDAFLRRIEGRT